MLANFHTHTTFCDGENTPEEVVLYAIDRGFDVIGFSGHGYTPYDTTYCMQDTEGYIASVKTLKEKYKNKIQICLGIEEDAYSRVDRETFDYIIGSKHYLCIDNKYYPIDSSSGDISVQLKLFDGDIIKYSENYYMEFCDYIRKRKPDIVGHFDLITKYDEISDNIFLSNKEYLKLSEKYMEEAIKNDVIFEVNTGAISRGYRTTPYPNENLMYVLKKHDAKIILSSDSHKMETLDCNFKEMKALLRDIGFEYTYVLSDNEFKKDYL